MSSMMDRTMELHRQHHVSQGSQEDLTENLPSQPPPVASSSSDLPILTQPVASASAKKQRPTIKRTTTREAFQAQTTFGKLKRNAENPGSEVQTLYVGIAIRRDEELFLDLAIHDGTYCIDFKVEALPGLRAIQTNDFDLTDHILEKLRKYRKDNLAKFAGAGLTVQCSYLLPELPALLWSELDIVAFVFKGDRFDNLPDEDCAWLARETVKQFGPTKEPHLMLGKLNVVDVDGDSEACRAHITTLLDYPGTVHKQTWDATMFYADSLKKNKVRIAFFNSTPQGGGVALMRHALIRFLRLVGVDCKWYTPNPRANIFRITKNNHNILQGVEKDPEKRLTKTDIEMLDRWAQEEADYRGWTRLDGPLASREKGGADVIIVDDPQLPSLVKIAKERDLNRPVIYRSHIQVRADLADQEGTPTAGVWNWVWDNVKDCDVFVSHPVPQFVPKNVTPEKVGYLPATTDWLDGLNKPMDNFDKEFYMHAFNNQCFNRIQRSLDWPDRQYIVQIARFDPAKGISDVLEAYAELRNVHMKDFDTKDTPHLVIAGHGAIDDPDAAWIYDETMEAIETKYSAFKDDIMVMRLGPSDQILNALMSCAQVALQLSTREGFEVKVSEALHAGTPIIATRRGGIPLQVQHGKAGFLVESGDCGAVARHLFALCTDEKLRADMSLFAEEHVSDEVSTVGNALSWLYLADTLARGETVKPGSRWINDMAREKAGVPYTEEETRLPRDLTAA